MSPALIPPSPLLILRLRRLGIIVPIRMVTAARQCGLPLALAASILIQESGGGHNEWGHDPTVMIGAGPVTKKSYLAYRAQRVDSDPRTFQGCGPCQLTWWSEQDAADKLGGCWDPLSNMRAGFAELAANVRRDGWRLGVQAYNGSGPAAVMYAATVLNRAAQFGVALRLPPFMH